MQHGIIQTLTNRHHLASVHSTHQSFRILEVFTQIKVSTKTENKAFISYLTFSGGTSPFTISWLAGLVSQFWSTVSWFSTTVCCK